MSISAQRDFSQMAHAVIAPLIVDSDMTLPAHNVLVHAVTTTARTLTMPNAGEALAFVPYIIRLHTDGGNLTVAFPEGAHNPADAVLTVVNDYIVAVSDGTFWYNLAEISTP